MPIRPKGDGRCIMVSAFLCECHGLLKLNESEQQQHPDIPGDSTVILKFGINAEGYWKHADLVQQLKEKAIPVFKALHPDSDGICLFDNSQTHHAKPPDALSGRDINLKDSGKNARPMRNGWYIDSSGQRVNQIIFSDSGLKGLQIILTERGL
jgi:hypothetical protein